MPDNKNFLHFEQVVGELQADIERVNTSSFSQAENEVWEVVMSRIKAFFGEIEKNISSIADDLKKTRQELKKSSNKLLIQASEQLDKVTKSTQKVADNVMNRIDMISERQNAVSGHLKEIKKNVETLASEDIARSVVESANKIEKEESLIQMEAFEIMNEMQFQDITAQQIQQVIYLIGETENKLRDFGQILAMLKGGKSLQSQGGSSVLDFDPNATLEDRQMRQGLADEITNRFTKKN